MKKPTIAKLNTQQRHDVINSIKSSAPEFEYKDLVVDTLGFFDSLIEELKGSRIDMKRLKEILLLRSEELKKQVQAH